MFPHTIAQLRELHKQAMQELVKEAGTIPHLAKMLGKPVGTVQGWVDRGRISKEGANLVAEHPALKDKFPVSMLRPEFD